MMRWSPTSFPHPLQKQAERPHLLPLLVLTYRSQASFLYWKWQAQRPRLLPLLWLTHREATPPFSNVPSSHALFFTGSNRQRPQLTDYEVMRPRLLHWNKQTMPPSLEETARLHCLNWKRHTGHAPVIKNTPPCSTETETQVTSSSFTVARRHRGHASFIRTDRSQITFTVRLKSCFLLIVAPRPHLLLLQGLTCTETKPPSGEQALRPHLLPSVAQRPHLLYDHKGARKHLITEGRLQKLIIK